MKIFNFESLFYLNFIILFLFFLDDESNSSDLCAQSIVLANNSEFISIFGMLAIIIGSIILWFDMHSKIGIAIIGGAIFMLLARIHIAQDILLVLLFFIFTYLLNKISSWRK